jgi:F-type H+-transporting ATPase subunit gamma
VADYIKFEPRPGEVLDFVADRLARADIVHFLSESLASEHSMRMMAMKNATDNATSLSDDLTLAMNKERQAAITQELSEISAGAEAVS